MLFFYLSRDGEKMSKRKKNYPDPMSVVNKYGADALRLVVCFVVANSLLMFLEYVVFIRPEISFIVMS